MKKKKKVIDKTEEIEDDDEEIDEEDKKILGHINHKLEKEKSMKLSIKEGSASAVMSGLGDNYITPFALSLNASSAQIGFLSAFASLIPPIAQIFGSRLMEKYSRGKIIVNFVTLQALMWLPMILLALFFWKNIFVSYLPIILIIFYSIYGIFGALAGPSWFSLMGDIVPEKIRGKYFGARNKITGTIALLMAILASFLLDYFKTKGIILIGFSILFLTASIFRLIAAGLFRRHYNPELKLSSDYYFSFFQFIKRARKNNFGRFVLFTGLMYFAVSIAGPFFSVYLLRDLHASNVIYMAVLILSHSVFSLLFMPVWGRFADKYGNKELLRIGSFLLPLIPFLWLFSSNPIYLIFVPQLVSGIGWAAFNLGAGNFIYDSVSPQRRGLCVAYFNVVIGIGAFLGAIFGSFLASYIHVSFMNNLLLVFIISGLARFAVFFFLPMIKEVRSVEKSSAIMYFKEIKPLSGIIHELISDIHAIKMLSKKGKLNLSLELEL